MPEITALIPFIYNDPQKGLISVGEGESAIIEDVAEVKRLADAGILQITGVGKVVSRQPKIETANVSAEAVESSDKKRAKNKE